LPTGPSGTTSVVNQVCAIHHHLDDGYDSPRMTDELRQRNYGVNHKRVERLQDANGIVKDGCRRKFRTEISDVSAPPFAEPVQRDFTQARRSGAPAGPHLHPVR
jgi:transposase InsO family protein